MPLWQHYHQPKTVEEALAFLDSHDGRARIVGGGTDLLIEMQQGHKQPVKALVDVTAIEAISHIGQTGDHIIVGAAVPHTQIVGSELIGKNATCLVEGCGVIGGPQVRNVGTLGGNVAHALPAADGTTALVALNAQAEIASLSGRSWRPIGNMFQGPGRSAVDHSREMITRFRFQAAVPGTGTAFKRIMRPQGVALPILACAVWVRVDLDQSPAQSESAIPDATIVDARICIGPVRPVPCRAEEAEETLRGRSLSGSLDSCIAAAQSEFSPRSSKHRATSDYRVEMIEVLLRRALPLAARRAITGEAIPEGIGLQ